MLVPLSCRLSATGICFLGILFPPRNWALLTVGLPPGTRMRRRTRTRFPCSARMRPGWVGCPLYSGNDGVHTTVAWSSVAACRLFNGAVPETPVCITVPELDIDEASARVHVCSPGQPSPRLWPPDGTGTPWAFP